MNVLIVNLLKLYKRLTKQLKNVFLIFLAFNRIVHNDWKILDYADVHKTSWKYFVCFQYLDIQGTGSCPNCCMLKPFEMPYIQASKLSWRHDSSWTDWSKYLYFSEACYGCKVTTVFGLMTSLTIKNSRAKQVIPCVLKQKLLTRLPKY